MTVDKTYEMIKSVTKRADKLSAKEIVDAIEKNGYPKIQGQYISSYGKEIEGACALGQAALNLAPKNWTLQRKSEFASAIHSRLAKFGITSVVGLNDYTDMTLPENCTKNP
jgi:hypothetical protein